MSASGPTIVKIPVAEIHDWESFHAVFARTLGFPDFYGRNMNAWIDCMTSIDEPQDGMTSIHALKEGWLVLDLGECTDFSQRCPEQYEAILEGVGFVNYRRMDVGEKPVLAVSFWNRKPLLAK
jgi:Barstar (barnase inhibitor)